MCHRRVRVHANLEERVQRRACARGIHREHCPFGVAGSDMRDRAGGPIESAVACLDHAVWSSGALSDAELVKVVSVPARSTVMIVPPPSRPPAAVGPYKRPSAP